MVDAWLALLSRSNSLNPGLDFEDLCVFMGFLQVSSHCPETHTN